MRGIVADSFEFGRSNAGSEISVLPIILRLAFIAIHPGGNEPASQTFEI